MNETVSNLPIFDKFNALCGLIVAVLSYIFGEHWILFTAFLALNIVDYITGCLKSHINHKTNSAKGATGILKKLGYWLMILVGFGSSVIFMEIGEVLGVNLGITKMIGWYVLTTLIINELRSIIENFVEAGYSNKVLDILAKGLEVTEEMASKIIKEQKSSKEEKVDETKGETK